jgi:hypothetical protein
MAPASQHDKQCRRLVALLLQREARRRAETDLGVKGRLCREFEEDLTLWERELLRRFDACATETANVLLSSAWAYRPCRQRRERAH